MRSPSPPAEPVMTAVRVARASAASRCPLITTIPYTLEPQSGSIDMVQSKAASVAVGPRRISPTTASGTGTAGARHAATSARTLHRATKTNPRPMKKGAFR